MHYFSGQGLKNTCQYASVFKKFSYNVHKTKRYYVGQLEHNLRLCELFSAFIPLNVTVSVIIYNMTKKGERAQTKPVLDKISRQNASTKLGVAGFKATTQSYSRVSCASQTHFGQQIPKKTCLKMIQWNSSWITQRQINLQRELVPHRSCWSILPTWTSQPSPSGYSECHQLQTHVTNHKPSKIPTRRAW